MMGKRKELFHGKQNDDSVKPSTSTSKSLDVKTKQKRVEFEEQSRGVSKKNDFVIDTDFGPVFIPQE